MTNATTETRRVLPLKASWFHIMLTLARGAAHGYAIRKEVESHTGGRVKLWPTTLYKALADLSHAGFVEVTGEPEDESDNLGRIVYRLTPVGHEILAAEADRMEALVEATRAAQGAARPGTA